MSKGNRNRLKREKRNQRSKMKKKLDRMQQNTASVRSRSIRNLKKGWCWMPWDEKPTRITPPTKERMENFLKEIGGTNPFDYENTNSIELTKQKRTVGYLWFYWTCQVLGKGQIVEKNMTTQEKLDVFSNHTVDVVNWFAECEHLITNNEMFWTLITPVWTARSDVFTNNPHILERYGRDKVSLEKKMECADIFSGIVPLDGNENISTRNETESSTKLMMHLLDSIKGDEVVIYRSFSVEKGKSVRKGVKKINNPDWYIQEEGAGWSYSTNKTNSVIVNGLINTFPYKNYLNMNDESAKKHLYEQRTIAQNDWDNPTHNCNFYKCLGTYSVKKKDIMFMTDDYGEMEIVVNPKDVKLLHYSFLNIFDLITQSLILRMLCMKEDDGKVLLGRSAVLNVDGFYYYMRKLVKRMCIDAPKYIINYLTLTDYKEEDFNTDNWIKKLFTMMVGSAGDNQFFTQSLLWYKGTNAECKKSLVGLGKDDDNIDYFADECFIYPNAMNHIEWEGGEVK